MATPDNSGAAPLKIKAGSQYDAGRRWTQRHERCLSVTTQAKLE